MKIPLWIPSEERKRNARITHFIQHVNDQTGLEISDYAELHRWSVENIPAFWETWWHYSQVIASQSYESIVDDLERFPGAKWFIGARLNFAENLLRYRGDRTAFIFRGESIISQRMTYGELYSEVARVAHALRELGVRPGDRIVGYMPNLIETAVSMLAATSIGAVWASCATDLGAQAAVDRLGQVEPKVMFTVDSYLHKGQVYDTRSTVAKIADAIPSLEKTIVIRYALGHPDISEIPNGVLYEDFLPTEPRPLAFEQLPFDHPIYIMFSSGTTGKPKCMVQGAGVLLGHMREHWLSADLTTADVMMYVTTCSWMMWNWLISGLATGASLVLYDGNATFPDTNALWRLIESERISIFGTSATYINFLKGQGVQPGKTFDLSSLKEILQTGSPLSEDGFEYIYRSVKSDVHFNSISGGTDINGCFACGNPISPVYAGQLQGLGLGMQVQAYDESGNSVVDRQGELVCLAPSPSMPLYFWADPDGSKYKHAYFDYFPGKNVWRHGDYVRIHSDTGGVTIYGRSDAVLKPSGVRIGTAEIYSVIEKIPGIADSVAVGQAWKEDQRVILFIKMNQDAGLTLQLKERIKRELREKASPRHVPALILEIPDIPYTFNMKKVEAAITNIVNGKPVINRDALINPESLDHFIKLLPDLLRD